MVIVAMDPSAILEFVSAKTTNILYTRAPGIMVCSLPKAINSKQLTKLPTFGQLTHFGVRYFGKGNVKPTAMKNCENEHIW